MTNIVTFQPELREVINFFQREFSAIGRKLSEFLKLQFDDKMATSSGLKKRGKFFLPCRIVITVF